jgi:hypothetical protein
MGIFININVLQIITIKKSKKTTTEKSPLIGIFLAIKKQKFVN